MSKTRKKALVVERGAAFTRLEIRLLGAAVIAAAAVSLILSLVVETTGAENFAALNAPAATAATAADR
jgi:hypothetical protein